MRGTKPSNSATIQEPLPKIIFLDVDGVLNSAFDVTVENQFDDKMVDWLVYLVNESGAKIVVHSSWKYHKDSLKKLTDRLAQSGLETFDVTPTIFGPNCGRVNEIKQWLNEHPHDPERWVMLDDWDYRKEFGKHMIQTWSHDNNKCGFGLNEAYVKQALAILNR